MADEETNALGLSTGQRRTVQVIAHLETLDRPIEPRRHRAGPGLIQVLAIDPPPTRTERAVFREQALVALAVMERAQGHQGQLCRCRGQYRPGRHFRPVQRNGRCAGYCDRQYGQRRAGRRYRSGDHSGTQVPVVFIAGYAALEQAVIECPGRDRLCQRKGAAITDRAPLGLDHFDAILSRLCARTAQVRDRDGGAAGE
ncbi:hypothetical protein D3C76_1042160 [compost metagenome]